MKCTKCKRILHIRKYIEDILRVRAKDDIIKI